MKLNLNIEISEDSGEGLIEFKKLLRDKLKAKKIQVMEDSPLPFKGTGLSGTISPGITPLEFPFLD